MEVQESTNNNITKTTLEQYHNRGTRMIQIITKIGEKKLQEPYDY